MELEEMKVLWEEMSQRVDQKNKLTDNTIMEMTKKRYVNQVNSISKYETFGAYFCIFFALLILFNFNKLDTFYFQASGIFAVVFNLLLPILSLRAIAQMKRINLAEQSYKQTLVQFTKARQQFLMVQKIGLALAVILMIISVPLARKIMTGENLFLNDNFTYWYVPIGLIFVVLFGRWGYNCYFNMTASAESILKELDD